MNMVDRGRRWRTSTPTRIGKMDHGPNSGLQGTSKVHSRSQRSFENLQWQAFRRNPMRFSLVCGVLMLVGYRVFWENLEPRSSSPSTPREGNKSDGLVRCRYHGNCPIGTICHFVDGNCHPYHYVDDLPKHRGRRDYLIERMGGLRNFDHCTRVCLEELTVEEGFQYASVPIVESELPSALPHFGCVLHYRRQKRERTPDGSSSIWEDRPTTEQRLTRRFRSVLRVDPLLWEANTTQSVLKARKHSKLDHPALWAAVCDMPCENDQDCPNQYSEQKDASRPSALKCRGRKNDNLLTTNGLNKHPTDTAASSQHDHKFDIPAPSGTMKTCQFSQDFDSVLGSRTKDSFHASHTTKSIWHEDMIVVSGADRTYFKGLANLAASLFYWAPTRKLVVYNLGMSEEQLAQVRKWPNLHRLHWAPSSEEDGGIPRRYPPHVRNNLKNYAWKSLIINETVHEYKSIFWLDAGATFVGPIERIEEIVHIHGIFLVKGQDEHMKYLSHDSMYQHLVKMDKVSYSKFTGPHFAGGIQGHVYPSRYIDSIVVPNALCALDSDCIAPSGSSLANHRYDQSSLSILAYQPTVRAPAYTEFLAASRDQLNPSGNLSASSQPYILWTSRQSCSYYLDIEGDRTAWLSAIRPDDDYDYSKDVWM